ncbi:phage antirepressor N-terminal domain-containing protein [Paenibacillus peoriae]|uniref:phage antirepressor N-terminal domain-containing protein n=1 Tax=Paenibacillus peoriae TaxID=59893 RepID=UPI00026C641D|nr:phage antirepressor N-terminal domain-containing protein [Paenibacillus peoriae]MEC0184431.1 phage antirepressor N-terminal domain-containing protein [Paenibacillus peoriae]
MKDSIQVIEQKLVGFNDTELLGVKTDDDKISVGVSFICNGIGLSSGQRDRQVKNVQEDVVLKMGSRKLSVKFDDQVREALFIELEYHSLWLAKITITPAMQTNQREVASKLVEYQSKAKDVLAAAFIYNPAQKYLSTTTERLEH